jgi:hypothetical protein
MREEELALMAAEEEAESRARRGVEEALKRGGDPKALHTFKEMLRSLQYMRDRQDKAQLVVGKPPGSQVRAFVCVCVCVWRFTLC